MTMSIQVLGGGRGSAGTPVAQGRRRAKHFGQLSRVCSLNVAGCRLPMLSKKTWFDPTAGVSGFGFLGFRVWGPGSGVQGLGLWEGSGFGVLGILERERGREGGEKVYLTFSKVKMSCKELPKKKQQKKQGVKLDLFELPEQAPSSTPDRVQTDPFDVRCRSKWIWTSLQSLSHEAQAFTKHVANGSSSRRGNFFFDTHK